MTATPKPTHRLATDSTAWTPPPGLRWVFVIDIAKHILVQTALKENSLPRFKLPQVPQTAVTFKPDLDLMLSRPPFNYLALKDVTPREMTGPIQVSLPSHAREHKRLTTQDTLGGLEIIYVHVKATLSEPFPGNDFLKLMTTKDLMEQCQSYRYADYQQVLKSFGLI